MRGKDLEIELNTFDIIRGKEYAQHRRFEELRRYVKRTCLSVLWHNQEESAGHISFVCSAGRPLFRP